MAFSKGKSYDVINGGHGQHLIQAVRVSRLWGPPQINTLYKADEQRGHPRIGPYLMVEREMEKIEKYQSCLPLNVPPRV